MSFSEEFDSNWSVAYSFQVGGEQYGGTSTLKPIPGQNVTNLYPQGTSVRVSYDPLNPERSSIKRPSDDPR